MLSREQVHDAVLAVTGTLTCNEDPRLEDEITDAIMALLPDAETLGKAVFEVCGLPWSIQGIDATGECETWTEVYTKFGRAILDSLRQDDEARKERDG